MPYYTLDHIEIRQRGPRWRLVAATLAPFAAASIYLFFTRWPSYRFTAFSDYVSLADSILAGAAFVATLPIRPSQRVLSLLIYIPVLAVLLFFYTFWFIAVVFHNGL
ncbi:MAG: hypothetical protein ABI651_12085 [Verrucomicrobiota bacterium]